ncbi:MAG: hypothetical protein AAF438_08285 [Pseudomonadota bacterium]
MILIVFHQKLGIKDCILRRYKGDFEEDYPHLDLRKRIEQLESDLKAAREAQLPSLEDERYFEFRSWDLYRSARNKLAGLITIILTTLITAFLIVGVNVQTITAELGAEVDNVRDKAESLRRWLTTETRPELLNSIDRKLMHPEFHQLVLTAHVIPEDKGVACEESFTITELRGSPKFELSNKGSDSAAEVPAVLSSDGYAFFDCKTTNRIRFEYQILLHAPWYEFRPNSFQIQLTIPLSEKSDLLPYVDTTTRTGTAAAKLLAVGGARSGESVSYDRSSIKATTRENYLLLELQLLKQLSGTPPN